MTMMATKSIRLMAVRLWMTLLAMTLQLQRLPLQAPRLQQVATLVQLLPEPWWLQRWTSFASRSVGASTFRGHERALTYGQLHHGSSSWLETPSRMLEC